MASTNNAATITDAPPITHSSPADIIPTQPDNVDVEQLPKADITPHRVAHLPTTSDSAPAVAIGEREPHQHPLPLDPQVKDLGWCNDPKVPIPILHGMTNEQLWLLIRRFNRQIFRVKAIDHTPPGNLDFYISNKEEFSPDKLRATLERLYTTVVIGIAAFFKHVARIRSWHERRRTAGFCNAYMIAWLCNLVVPSILALVIILILFPNACHWLFPPAPLAAINAQTGEAQIPIAGHLGSKHSLTGAAEVYEGETAEREACNLIGALGNVAVSTAAGKSTTKTKAQEQRIEVVATSGEGDESALAQIKDPEKSLPDPTRIAATSHDAQNQAEGGITGKPKKGDHSKAPMEEAIFKKLGPTMHLLNNVCDDWERFGNALSPVPPFLSSVTRFCLAAVVTLLFLVSLYVTAEMVYRRATLVFGFITFGQPIFDRIKILGIIEWLDRHYSNWRAALELRNNILYGVPTNAQLTITLLRIGEANKAPLPPPPPSFASPAPDALQGSEMVEHPDLPHEYSELLAERLQERQEEMETARQLEVEGEVAKGEMGVARVAGEVTAGTDMSETEPIVAKVGEEELHKRAKPKSKALSFFKGVTKAGVESALGINRVKATVGYGEAKARIGVVTSEEEKRKEIAGEGPVSFRARYDGRKGLLIISTSATTPCVSFALEKSDIISGKGIVPKHFHPIFSIAINGITEIRKIGGFGWKGKLLVGWALGAEVLDGLEIVAPTKAVCESKKREAREDEGDVEVKRVTALVRRDEVFNRLVAIGNQKWEVF